MGDLSDKMLTTSDNPYNPFTQYDQWYAWDERMGYCTPSYLARIVHSSDDMSEADQAQAIDYAMEEILEENINGMYIAVASDAVTSD